MPTPSDRRGNRTAPAKEGSKATVKKPYRTPRLVTYGDLSKLALAKGGASADGPGSPNSKN